jgi:hypothetical protein
MFYYKSLNSSSTYETLQTEQLNNVFIENAYECYYFKPQTDYIGTPLTITPPLSLNSPSNHFHSSLAIQLMNSVLFNKSILILMRFITFLTVMISLNFHLINISFQLVQTITVDVIIYLQTAPGQKSFLTRKTPLIRIWF